MHPLCLVTDTIDISDVLALANSITTKDAINLCSFDSTSVPTEFGTDNCATHLIFSQPELFTSMIKSTTIGVKGVAGSSSAEGIGAIKFTIQDEASIQHTTTPGERHLPSFRCKESNLYLTMESR